MKLHHSDSALARVTFVKVATLIIPDTIYARLISALYGGKTSGRPADESVRAHVIRLIRYTAPTTLRHYSPYIIPTTTGQPR